MFEDHHGACGFSALVMGNIEAFHPFRKPWQMEQIFQFFHCPLFSGVLVFPLQFLVGKILGSIGHGHVLQPPFESPLGQDEADFAAPELCHPGGNEILFRRKEGQDDFFGNGGGIGTVEIADEGGYDFFVRFVFTFRNAEVFLAHHAAVADIEDFQSCMAAVSGIAYYVEVPFVGYDVLALLYGFDGPDLVPEMGGQFIVHFSEASIIFCFSSFTSSMLFPSKRSHTVRT